MSVGVDFDFPKWIAARRGAQEQQAREGAAYAFSGERTFRRTLGMARPVVIALEASTRLWRDKAREELLGKAVKITDTDNAPQLARAYTAAKEAGAALRVRVPPMYALPNADMKIKVLGTEDAPHLIVNLEVARQLDDQQLVAAIAHELGHVQNGHILFTTALYYLTHSAAFFVRWAVQPAIVTLQAWSRRADITCDRAALLAVQDLETTLTSLVKLELGIDRGAAFSVEEYLAAPPDPARGLGRWAELFRSHPLVSKRVQALRLFANSALYAQVKREDPAGKPSFADVDKQVSELISVI